MSLPCQKNLFALDAGIYYLNGAYMSPQLNSVEAAGMQAMQAKRSPNRISPSDFFTEAEKLRSLFAALVHAPDAESVCLIPSVSYGMAIIARNLPAHKGQKIILAAEQFPSNVYPWMRLASEKKLDLEFVAMPQQARGRGREWNARLLEAIDKRTALVALGSIHWANGALFDLKSIADRVHAFGGLLVVDGTQSVGALPLDVPAAGFDALVCAGYKWLMGPYGLGYAWLGTAFQHGQPLEENWINRLESENFAGLVAYKTDYQPGARRFDVGERSSFIHVPMAIQALNQLLDWGVDSIQEYCRQLTAEAIPQWESAGFGIDDPENRAEHLFGLQLPPGKDPESLQHQLRKQNIYVSVRGNFVRISPNVYNDSADIQALTHALTTF